VTLKTKNDGIYILSNGYAKCMPYSSQAQQKHQDYFKRWIVIYLTYKKKKTFFIFMFQKYFLEKEYFFLMTKYHFTLKKPKNICSGFSTYPYQILYGKFSVVIISLWPLKNITNKKN